MRNKPERITQLCESWWTKLASSTRDDQQRFAAEFLGLLGWEDPEPLHHSGPWVQRASSSYVLRAGGQPAVAAFFVTPGTLEPPGSLDERGLDFCETTRLLVNGARALSLHYAFITDLYRSYFYDVRTDELLLHADAPAAFEEHLRGVLCRADIERGALDEIRRQPRSYGARQLREWRGHWRGVLCDEGHLPAEQALDVMDRLVLCGFLFDHDILKKPRWNFRERFGRVVMQAFQRDHSGVGRELVRLFRALHREWKAKPFATDPAMEAALSNDGLAAPLLREFTLLSRSKFAIATILESFNHGEPAEKARVRMVPAANKRRTDYLDKQTVESVDRARLEVDIADEGYRAIFFWFDKLVALYDRVEVDFEAQQDHHVPPQDMDLFTWAEKDAARPQALVDKRRHAAARGLTVYYSNDRQLRTAQLLLYLHVIARYHQTKQPFKGFPDLSEAFLPRPRVLDSDRTWLNQDQGHDEEGEEWAAG